MSSGNIGKTAERLKLDIFPETRGDSGLNQI